MNCVLLSYDIRDRDRYVQGDFRFRNGYSKHNPRKMVQKWAEKEMRNLMRFTFVLTSFSSSKILVKIKVLPPASVYTQISTSFTLFNEAISKSPLFN